MVVDISVSGVIFTHELKNRALTIQSIMMISPALQVQLHLGREDIVIKRYIFIEIQFMV